MKFKTVIYVTKDNSPGIDSWAEKKYDEQFNRIDGTVENEEEWNKFWTSRFDEWLFFKTDLGRKVRKSLDEIKKDF